MKVGVAAIVLSAVLAVFGCGDEGTGSTSPPSTGSFPRRAQGPEPSVALPRGAPPKTLAVRELEEGTGREARPGDLLSTQFVAVYVTGRKLESSWEPKQGPFSFRLGADEANPGWEQGIRGMKVGGRRELIVPPNLSSRFGTRPGSGPDDTLVYVVELLGVRPGSSPPPSPAQLEKEVEARGEPRVLLPAGPPPKRLRVRDLIIGRGATAQDGDWLKVEYVGVGLDGSRFTNSWKRSVPFWFQLGADSLTVNAGWEQGLGGMRVGGRRELVIPPTILARGSPPSDDPADTLLYIVDLLRLR